MDLNIICSLFSDSKAYLVTVCIGVKIAIINDYYLGRVVLSWHRQVMLELFCILRLMRGVRVLEKPVGFFNFHRDRIV